MHVHFREGHVLKAVVPETARHFDIAVAMPNLVPPITDPAAAQAYCDEIRAAARGVNDHFRPLGVAYLTDNLSAEVLREGFRFSNNGSDRAWFAAKLYPANATTNSALGVSSIEKIYPLLEVMEEIGMPLLVHGELLEHNGIRYAPWDRERVFLEHVLPKIERFSTLKIVLEHISTEAAAMTVIGDETGRLAATITPHHLTTCADDMVNGGLRTHAYCMPIMKTHADREKLRWAATQDHPRIFAGTDSAPHTASRKHSSCCPGGAFVAPGALEAYAAVFEEEGALGDPSGVTSFERFMSTNGPNFYGIEPSRRSITLIPNAHDDAVTSRVLIPADKVGGGAEEVVPFYHKDLGFAPRFPRVVGRVVKAD
jgi:dihydroorotase